MLSDRQAEFRVWAPRPESLQLRIGGEPVALSDAGYGVFETLATVEPADRLRLCRQRLSGPRSVLALAARGTARALAGARRARSAGARRRLRGAGAARCGHLRAARRHLHRRGHVRGRRRAPARAGPARRDRDRDHAGGRVPRRPRLGLRRRLHLGRAVVLRRPGGVRRAGGGRPPRGAGGDPRRRLQPPRRLRRAGLRGLRAVLHRQVRDAVGQGDQLRRRRLRPGARVGVPERGGLGARLRDRRPAPRRHPRDLRLQRRAHRRPGGPARARGQPARLRDRRVGAQRPGGDARRATAAAGAATPPGPTTSTTRCGR